MARPRAQKGASTAGAPSGPTSARTSAPRAARARGERITSDALLLRRVPYGEADLILTFFTEARGVLSAAARAARKSVKRFGALEPLHLLRVTLEDRPGADLGHLVEAQIVRPRLGLLADLQRIDAASIALQWVRRASPHRVAEPTLWDDLNALLDELDTGEDPALVRAHLAAMGLRLLQAAGWGLELAACVRCGRECDPEATACIDASRGGLVCRACGGARVILRPARRSALQQARDGDPSVLSPDDATCAIDLVSDALKAHAAT